MYPPSAHMEPFKALVVADHGRTFADIRESMAGAIFLGVPMQGCDAAGFVAWAEGAIGNEQPLLDTLRRESQDLLSLTRDFWSSYGSLPMTCFFENMDSKYLSVKIKVCYRLNPRYGLWRTE